MSFKPVIFLVFANDKVDNTQYLRNLSAESHGINKALEAAARSGLCDVVEKYSASVDDIVDVFTDPRYKSRISIFHYGGHANGFSLLLESIDGSKNLTHKDGLVPFLARQENLKLVFLNGCSSEGQASDLLRAGIPAVIGTTSAINDEVATGLAIRFYGSLANGAGIEKAWADGTDEVKIEHGAKDTRALFWEDKKEPNDHFPWIIQFKAEDDFIKLWNLPDISGNPLYSLPEIDKNIKYPETPFLGLKHYTSDHARVFFGRSKHIRDLYDALTETDAPQMISLYGKIGVGKSSLLHAGLLPRAAKDFSVIYVRRDRQIGWSKSIYRALLHFAGYQTEEDISNNKPPDNTIRAIGLLKKAREVLEEGFKSEIDSFIEKINISTTAGTIYSQPENTREAYKEVEMKFKKPILIILDQIEEAYTQINTGLPHELNELFLTLKDLFSTENENALKGKVILSFREEFYRQIEVYRKGSGLPSKEIPLYQLNKGDVEDVFNSLGNLNIYNLKIEENLPQIIASDITTDPKSPIALMLQILLTKMWEKVTVGKNKAEIEFNFEDYQVLKDNGLAMDEFLHNQLNIIKKKLPNLFEVGFILDVLNFYCTPNSTSATRTLQQLVDNYPSAIEEVKKVLKICESSLLITDLGGTESLAMLAHDLLAKSVIKMQSQSAKELQQAKRILASKMGFAQDSSESTLNELELNLIDKTKKYFPHYREEESILIENSRKEISKKNQQKKLIRWAKQLVILSIILFSIVVSVLRKESDFLEKISFINEQAVSAMTNLNKDPTLSTLQSVQGFSIAEELQEDKYLSVVRYFGLARYFKRIKELTKKKESSFSQIGYSITDVFYRSLNGDTSLLYTPIYDTLYKAKSNFNDLIVQRDQKRLIPFSITDSALVILDFDLKASDRISTKASHFTRVMWNKDGNNIITLDNQGTLRVHNENGKVDSVGSQKFQSFDISPKDDFFVAYAHTDPHQSKIKIFNSKGILQDSIKMSDSISHISYTPDGQYLLSVSSPPNTDMSNVELINIYSHKRDKVASAANIGIVQISPNGNLIVASTLKGVIVWDKNGRQIKKIRLPASSTSENESSNKIYDLTFHPVSDSLLVICSQSNEAYLFNVFSQNEPIPLRHEYIVTSVVFSDNGKMILTCSGDNTASVWDLSGKKLYQLKGHSNDVTKGVFINDDHQIITSSLDGTIRRWNLNEYHDVILRGHTGPANCINYINQNSIQGYLVSSGADSIVRLWDLNSNQEIDCIDSMHETTRYVNFIDTNQIYGFNTNSAFLYNIPEKKLVKYIGHQDTIEWLEVFDDRIISVGRDSNLIFWDKSSGEPIKIIKSHFGKLWDLDISIKYKKVAIGTDNGKIMLFSYDGNPIDTLDKHVKPVNYIDISKDGLYMVSASQDGTAIIWDMKENKELSRLQDIGCAIYSTCEVISANFSNNGKMVVTASSDRSVRLWNLDGEILAHMEGHSEPIVDAFFSPNDDMVYSFSTDKTVRLWSLKGKEINVYADHHTKVNSAIMDLEDHIYSASDDGTIHIWLTPKGVYRRLKDEGVLNRKFDNFR